MIDTLLGLLIMRGPRYPTEQDILRLVPRVLFCARWERRAPFAAPVLRLVRTRAQRRIQTFYR